MVKPNPNTVGIDRVIAAELDDIANRRGDADASSANPANWKQECHDRKLFGICLSGGGIRSATFALGVLQGLAEQNVLPKADYLSTVSGGGYIGSWLQALLNRLNAGPHAFDVLQSEEPGPPTTDPISFLRKYSDYLSPQSGLSLDAVVIPVIWLRNALLNQAIFVAAFLAAFSLLLIPPVVVDRIANPGANCSLSAAFLELAAVFALVVVYWISRNLSRIGRREHEETVEPLFPPGEGTERVGTRVVLPLFLAVFFLVLCLVPAKPVLESVSGQWAGFAILAALLAALQWGGGFVECWTEQRMESIRARRQGRNQGFYGVWAWLVPRLHVLWMAAVTAGFLILLFKQVYKLVVLWRGAGSHNLYGSANIVAWVPPLFLVALMVGITLQIGLMGRDFPDASREWLSRVGALTWVICFGWAATFAIGLFSPYWIILLWKWKGLTVVVPWVTAWAGTTISSVLAGKSGKTGAAAKDNPGFSVSLDVIARYGPFVAVPGILIALAFGLQLLLRVKQLGGTGVVATLASQYWNLPAAYGGSWWYPLKVFAALCAAFLVLSVRVNINEFSMHHFYKNRLVRCFLGASAAKRRQPDSFTGFDSQDDIPLATLRCDKLGGTLAPYPILNATITVTVGSELATQERKAVPWIFTPRYSGFHLEESAANKALEGHGKRGAAFVDTGEVLGSGVHLGTAMAISGAALNPSDGFHFAPQTAFLMTLFDVRLGWWIGNPRDDDTYRRTGPRFALFWLLRELFGFVGDRSGYLNLSDGGNFENLGMYELIRRRCRYVIAVDGEEDPHYVFESLGAAVRKCREDFGVEIDIDPRPIVPQGQLSSTHCVVGRIYYPEASEPGWLLYMKASVTGNEPADVEQYRRQHPEFPQQSTTQQFFLESQFESYRRLGLHVARTTFDNSVLVSSLDATFVHLTNRWDTPPKAPDGSAAQHAAEYVRLIERLADTPGLTDLDSDTFESFPSGQQPTRTASFFRIELLQLMETVFSDLGFASSHAWNHPANAGWKRVFEYWASQPEMRKLWQAQKLSYSKPFQDFVNALMSESETRPPWRLV